MQEKAPTAEEIKHHQIKLLLRIQSLEEQNADLRDLLAEARRMRGIPLDLLMRIDGTLEDHKKGLTGELKKKLEQIRIDAETTLKTTTLRPL